MTIEATDNAEASPADGNDPDNDARVIPDTRCRLTVTNVEEPGEVTLTTLQPQEGVPITATLTDSGRQT